MEILECEQFDAHALLDSIKRTKLKGHEQAEVYKQAKLSLVPRVDTNLLYPAQRYVLRPGVQKTIELRTALLDRGIDIFALEGGVWVRTSDHRDERIPVIPPVIEESLEPDGRTILLINDGMHRVYAARSLGLPITVVLARGVPTEFPYYAFALPDGWQTVEELDTLPDSYQKKAYRDPENYKALFRDFNALFPGVQKQRKQTNPGHLVA